MVIKVDYDKLDELGNEVIKQDEYLVSLFSDLLKIIVDLNDKWTGPDCENFQTISTTYIKNLESVTDKINYIGNFMKDAAKYYYEKDHGWEKSVKKIGEEQNEYR